MPFTLHFDLKSFPSPRMALNALHRSLLQGMPQPGPPPRPLVSMELSHEPPSLWELVIVLPDSELSAMEELRVDLLLKLLEKIHCDYAGTLVFPLRIIATS
jgi:hypothetical protein